MPSEKEKMLSGDLYDAGDPELVEERQYARALIRLFNDTTEADGDQRDALLRELFGSAGEGLFVEPTFRCDYGYNIHVGDSFFANFGCVFLDVCRIEFGDDCLLGPGVHVYTATHPLDAETRDEGAEYGKGVTVGDSAWIGGQAVLNPGVTLGDGVVVSSGSVVTEDVPDNVVVRGNPAKVVKRLDD